MKATFSYQGITAYFWQESWSDEKIWHYCFDVDEMQNPGTRDLAETTALAIAWIDNFIAQYGPLEEIDLLALPDEFPHIEF